MAFAQQLSTVLTAHCDVLQQHKLQGYLRSVQQWLPRIEAFCDLKSAHPGHSTPAMAGTPGAPPTHSSAAEGGDEDRRRMSVKTSSARMSISGHGATTGGADASAQDRATLRRHTQLVKQIMALLQRNAVAVFSDCTKDLKPVLEICEITSGDTSVVVLSQISKFCNRLSQGAWRPWRGWRTIGAPMMSRPTSSPMWRAARTRMLFMAMVEAWVQHLCRRGDHL
jgi:hypothetical protein